MKNQTSIIKENDLMQNLKQFNEEVSLTRNQAVRKKQFPTNAQVAPRQMLPF